MIKKIVLWILILLTNWLSILAIKEGFSQDMKAMLSWVFGSWLVPIPLGFMLLCMLWYGWKQWFVLCFIAPIVLIVLGCSVMFR